MNANRRVKTGEAWDWNKLYKLHTINIPSVHATDFQLDLRLGSRGVGVGDILVRRYYRGKLSHSNRNRTSFSSRRLLHNAHYCTVRMRSGLHARGTTMASSEVLIRCSISVVKKRNTTSAVLAEDRKNWYRMPSDS